MRRTRADMRRRRARKRRRLFLTLTILPALAILALIFHFLPDSSHTNPDTEPETTAEVTTPDVSSDFTEPETESDTETLPAETTAPPTVPALAYTHTTLPLNDIRSQAGVLISLQDYTILAQKDSLKRIFPASITKVMTLIVACEHTESLEETFTLTSSLIDPVYLAGASLAGFQPNETVPIRDLLYGMILPSGGEAAVALAVYTAGSEEAFAELMNQKADELNLYDTHFVNCTGLHDEQHYSTCEDLARILAYAMQIDICREVLSTYQYTTTPTDAHPDGIQLTSTMFSRMYGDEAEGFTILAGKTGYTLEAHQCLSSYAVRNADGASFIFVSVGGENRYDPIYDAIDVYSSCTQS